MAADLTIRPMRNAPDDLERFRRCFDANGSPKRPEVVRWQYAENPTGELFVDLAVAPSGELAAIYATLPVRVRIAGEVRLAVQSVDTITDQAYRGKGLFLTLAKRTYERAAEAGAALVYGFPNGSSAHGFFERLAWRPLDPVPFLVRPLRTRYLAERFKLSGVPDLPLFARVDLLGRLGRYPVEPVTSFDDRFTELWHAAAGARWHGVERDARYLQWRLAKPGEAYTTNAVVTRSGLAAYASHCVKAKHGGQIGYLMEHLARPSQTRALASLLSRALADMTARGADVALAWCLPHAPAYRALLACGFVPFPTRYRPIELHAGVRAFAPELAATLSDRARWYLSYLDSDTV